MQKNFKAVVFDFGGVIELWKDGVILDDLAELVGISSIDFKTEYFKHNHLCNIGALSWEDVLMKVVTIFDDTKEIRDAALLIIEDYQSSKRINHELVSFFPRLKEYGYRVAILSNYASTLKEKLHVHGILELVDEVVVSGEIGFQKPHREAFQILFKRLDVRAEEVIFIDDAAKSLETAGEIGYMPILFKNNEQLKVDLAALGISL